MNPLDSAQQEVAEFRDRLLVLADRHLGRHAVKVIGASDLKSALKMQLAGKDDLDALLAQAFTAAATDPALRAEFFSFFWDRMPTGGATARYPILRRFLESGDLLASAFGDMMAGMQRLDFRGRHSFQAMLVQRLKWKTYAKLRRANRDTPELGCSGPEVADENLASDPARAFEDSETTREIMSAIASLRPRERSLVRLFLNGATGQEMALEVGMKPAASRRALQRALTGLRSILIKADRGRLE